jgi:hypothetical protein
MCLLLWNKSLCLFPGKITLKVLWHPHPLFCLFLRGRVYAFFLGKSLSKCFDILTLCFVSFWGEIWDKVSLCSPDQPWTHDPPASSFWVQELQACATMPGLFCFFLSFTFTLFHPSLKDSCLYSASSYLQHLRGRRHTHCPGSKVLASLFYHTFWNFSRNALKEQIFF